MFVRPREKARRAAVGGLLLLLSRPAALLVCCTMLVAMFMQQLGLGLAALLPVCVQKATDKPVVYLLDVSGHPNPGPVGLRGRDKPLSWDYDQPLTLLKKDCLYRAVVTIHTGYKATEVKFTLNGEFELKNHDNRRVEFGPSDTTVYRARFDVPPR